MRKRAVAAHPVEFDPQFQRPVRVDARVAADALAGDEDVRL